MGNDRAEKLKDLRKSAEEVLSKENNLGKFPITDTLKLIHELQVHQIELEMQNDELSLSQFELEDSRSKYVDLYDFAPVGYFTLDEKRFILELNLSATKLLGEDRKHIIKKSFSSYMDRENQGLFYLYVKKLTESSTKQTCELRMVRKNGTSFYAQLEGTAVYDNDGSFRHFKVAMLDVTERKRAEVELRRAHDELETRVRERTQELIRANEELRVEIAEREQTTKALREIEERYRTLVEHSYDLVCETSVDGRFLYASPNFKYLLGYEPDELLGKDIFENVHTDDSIAVRAEFQRAILTRSTGYAIFRYRHKDGEWRWLESTGKPFITATGDVRGVIASRDITERKRIEEELIKAQKLESIGILAGGISHDFNNILTGILGNISLAKTRIDPGDKAYKRLDEAEKACNRASNLTQQLLTFSKGGAPIRRVIPIGALIKESANFALIGSKVKSQFNIQKGLWLAEIDDGQISQVINNLVINADQAMPEGGMIRISAENIVVDDGDGLPIKKGRYVKITVEDEGTGIPEEHLPKIFDPYFTTKQSGSGLGLATTHSIIKNHDGYIEVESEVGVGTKFRIYLPASEEKRQTNPNLKQAPVSGKGMILLMDDEELVREVAGEILNRLGYEVEHARDGAEAIEMYRGAKENNRGFDAVIMDLTIPGGMGGKETIEKLREIDPDVKAIVSSGYSNDPVMSKFADYGFCGIIAKPYEIEELGKALNKIIKN